jgi:hypothetical protein
MNKLMEYALSQNDDRLVRVLNCDDFVLKGVYHNGCMTKYLLKSSTKNEQKEDIEKLKISVEDYPKSQTTSRLL